MLKSKPFSLFYGTTSDHKVCQEFFDSTRTMRRVCRVCVTESARMSSVCPMPSCWQRTNFSLCTDATFRMLELSERGRQSRTWQPGSSSLSLRCQGGDTWLNRVRHKTDRQDPNATETILLGGLNRITWPELSRDQLARAVTGRTGQCTALHNLDVCFDFASMWAI